MKNSVIASIPFSYVVITTIVYALLVNAFFEMDNAVGEGTNFLVDNNNNNNKTMNDTQLETQCKSPCPPTAEMCIEMCA